MWKEVRPQRLQRVCVFWICFFSAFLVGMAARWGTHELAQSGAAAQATRPEN
jgi:hypothetical protein